MSTQEETSEKTQTLLEELNIPSDLTKPQVLQEHSVTAHPEGGTSAAWTS